MTAADEDVSLMLRVKEGDESAFRRLFEKHAPRLVGYADRFFHNRSLSEDAAQEVFLRVWRARAGYRPEASFSSWLYTIATRVCLKQLGRRRPVAPASGEPALDRLPAATDTARQAQAAEEMARVLAAVDALPPQQRAALWLVRLGGFSYRQAAEILGVSLAAVKSALFRATEAVRQKMED